MTNFIRYRARGDAKIEITEATHKRQSPLKRLTAYCSQLTAYYTLRAQFMREHLIYRLLLPGIRLKRWVLINLAGMTVFAVGFALLLPAQSNPHQVLWHVWRVCFLHPLPIPLAIGLGIGLMLAGLLLAGVGTRRLIAAFTQVADPRASNRQILQRLIDERRPSPRLRVVGLGGGTGLSTLLRGLKNYPVEMTAIVTVTDDGGSSGRLRMDLNMPPPGDIRSCLIALADAEPLMERLFQHRFALEGGDRGEHSLDGHSLGNLIIAGLWDITGDFEQAVQEASRVLAVRGRVLPSADCPLVLTATMDDGQVVAGETAIIARHGVIASISIDPPDVPALPEALQAIREADVIILGPGSVYSSLLPNLLIPGMAEAIAAAQAMTFFVCNVMTQPGESDHFAASRHLAVMLQHLAGGNPFQYAVVNEQRPTPDILELYAGNGQYFVEPDLQQIHALGTIPVTGQLLADAHLARHDPDRLAHCILQTVAEANDWPELLNRRGE